MQIILKKVWRDYSGKSTVPSPTLSLAGDFWSHRTSGISSRGTVVSKGPVYHPEAFRRQETGNFISADSMTDATTKAVIQKRMGEIAVSPDAIARAIAFAIEQSADVDIGDIVIRPTAQDWSSVTKESAATVPSSN